MYSGVLIPNVFCLVNHPDFPLYPDMKAIELYNHPVQKHLYNQQPALNTQFRHYTTSSLRLSQATPRVWQIQLWIHTYSDVRLGPFQVNLTRHVYKEAWGFPREHGRVYPFSHRQFIGMDRAIFLNLGRIWLRVGLSHLIHVDFCMVVAIIQYFLLM